MELKLVFLIGLFSVANCYDPPASDVLPPYTPPGGYASSYQKPNGSPHASASNYASQSQSQSADANAQTLRQTQNIEPDGSYQFDFETDNGIQFQEQGVPKDLGGNPPEIAEQVSGFFQYTAPDGQLISLSYIADENGFQPSAEHLPTPPPIPEAIQRALQIIEARGGGSEYQRK